MSKEKNRCLDKETGQTRKSENDPGKNMKFGFIQNDIWIWWFQAHKYPLDHFKEETKLENREKNLGVPGQSLMVRSNPLLVIVH